MQKTKQINHRFKVYESDVAIPPMRDCKGKVLLAASARTACTPFAFSSPALPLALPSSAPPPLCTISPRRASVLRRRARQEGKFGKAAEMRRNLRGHFGKVYALHWGQRDVFDGESKPSEKIISASSASSASRARGATRDGGEAGVGGSRARMAVRGCAAPVGAPVGAPVVAAARRCCASAHALGPWLALGLPRLWFVPLVCTSPQASQDGKLIIWNGMTTNKVFAIPLR